MQMIVAHGRKVSRAMPGARSWRAIITPVKGQRRKKLRGPLSFITAYKHAGVRSVEDSLIIYVRGGVADAVSLLSVGCRQYGFSEWKPEGQPASQSPARPSFSQRIAILAVQSEHWQQAHPKDLVGLAHVMRVDGLKTRITILHENMTGNSLPSASAPRFQDFCLWFIHFLEAKSARLQGTDVQTEQVPDASHDRRPSDKRRIPS